SRRMTFAGLAPVFAIRPAGNWSRFSSFWGTFLCRRRNATWGASRDSVMQSMIESGWNRIRRDLLRSRTACRLHSTNPVADDIESWPQGENWCHRGYSARGYHSYQAHCAQAVIHGDKESDRRL